MSADVTQILPDRAKEIETLRAAAEEQREYERKRAILMDEAVLIATLLKQRIATYPGQFHVTGDGMLAVAATLYASLSAGIKEDV